MSHIPIDPPSNDTSSNRIVWFLLTTAILAIFGFVGAWANGINNRLSTEEHRTEELEKHFIVIETKLDTIADLLKRK